jgi:RNA polymerase sigma factor (sigma-70 family)
MPTPALRFEAPTFEPLFVESLTSYITLKCHEYRVRRENVSDVVQEALTTILASVRMFRPEKGDFDTWARGVARNVIRRHLRRAKRYGARFSSYPSNVDDYATHAPSPERCVQRKQAHHSISNALGKLTAKQASVVVLFDIDDLSHKEIGNDLDITEAASHMCHKRAHTRLAKCLDRELLSVMPPFVTSCNEPSSGKEVVSSNENGSRWTERSHYASQILGSLVALLLLVPACFEPQMRASMTGDARVLAPVQNAVMYSSDQPVDVHDEPVVHRDAPSVKLEPASLTSVRAVSTPAKVTDKPTYGEDIAPIPPFKPTESTTAHLPPGRLDAAF